jgi:putative toxin-antitoxin system antitoxin component (TIGR02293 family)
MALMTYTEMLGGAAVLGANVETPLEWVGVLEGGFPTQSVDAVIEAGVLSREEAEDLVIPRRTLSHRKQREQHLTLEESDRLARIVRVSARAAETFGDEDNARGWLRDANGALGGATPLSLLRTGEGAVLVEQILGRIDHGIFT